MVRLVCLFCPIMADAKSKNKSRESNPRHPNYNQAQAMPNVLQAKRDHFRSCERCCAILIQAFRLLDSIAEIKNGKKWWSLPLEDFEKGNPWTSVPNSVNVEMTGFALLTTLAREDSKFDETIPVVNWLLEQQNSQGGAWVRALVCSTIRRVCLPKPTSIK